MSDSWNPGFLSRTGIGAARVRAGMSRPSTPEGDPDAQRRLYTEFPPSQVRRPHLIARTRFFDEQVLTAVSGGMRQVVLCAAGYDDRAVRFWSPDVRFFDVDHPAIQTYKQHRFQAMTEIPDSLALVSADVRIDDIGQALAAAGHDAVRPTLFVCEGLLVYLQQLTVERLLARLRSRASVGALLTASLAIHAEGLDSERFTAAANARVQRTGGEPWHTILPESAWLRLLATTGWRATSRIDAASLEPDAPAGAALLVAATAA